MPKLTANPLTAAIIGFWFLATLLQCSKKFPLTQSTKVLFCISLMSAPAVTTKFCLCMQWRLLASNFNHLYFKFIGVDLFVA